MPTDDQPAPAKPLPYATPPELDPRVPKRSRLSRGAWLRVAGASALLLLLVAAYLFMSARSARSRANGIASATNLMRIGSAIQLYANSNGGRYPPSFDALLLNGSLAPAALVAPGSGDTPAAGPTPAALLANLRAGGHLSYVYCGQGRTTSAPPDVVIVHEAGHYALDGGRSFLYADGHVEMIWANLSDRMVKDIKSGVNPPQR